MSLNKNDYRKEKKEKRDRLIDCFKLYTCNLSIIMISGP